MTPIGSAPFRKLTARIAAAAAAVSLTLTASVPAAAGQDPAQDASQDAGQDASQDVSQDPGQDASQDVSQDAGQDPAQDAGQDASQDAGPFPDTPADDFYTQAVEALHRQGVFAGTLCDPGFCPDEALDRAVMAVWTVRVLDEQDPAEVTSTQFADVEATHPHAAFIERFAQLGVTQGCGDGSRYCPQDTVTRAHMAAFLTRAFELAEGPDPGFDDVGDDWYAPYVASLAASGITRGCGDGSGFCPHGTVTRAQMAVFLARALGLVETPGSTTGGDGGAVDGGFTSVTAGNKHACAVRADKSLECWGDNLERQTSGAHGEFVAVSAGGLHTCALRVDNTVSCWGNNENGQTKRPRTEFQSLSSGFRHTCAVSLAEGDGAAEATGATGAAVAASATGAAGAASATGAAGGSGGSVQCWGLDSTGQSTPTGGTAAKYLKVSAGYEHTCGLRTDGVVQCWGGNGHGQAGTENPTGPVTCTVSGCKRDYYPIAGTFTDVSAGTTHTCAVRTDRRLECWGESGEDQTTVPDGEFLAVSSGFKHSCALAVDNTVHCWGRGAYGETTAPAGKFLTVSAGSSFSCGVRTNGTLECWGYSADNRSTPPTE